MADAGMEKPEGEQEGDATVELPAPAGWSKKFTPKKGGTQKRKEIVFISPTGEEIRNKRQLGQYLRSHPGGPSSSEFNWGYGTPRRSARISQKANATEAPENEPSSKRRRTSSKRRRTSSSKEGNKKKDDLDSEEQDVEAQESEKIDAKASETIPDADSEGSKDDSEQCKEAAAAKTGITESNAELDSMTKPTDEEANKKSTDKDTDSIKCEETAAAKTDIAESNAELDSITKPTDDEEANTDKHSDSVKYEEAAAAKTEFTSITKHTDDEEANQKHTDKDSDNISGGSHGKEKENSEPKESSKDIDIPSLQKAIKDENATKTGADAEAPCHEAEPREEMDLRGQQIGECKSLLDDNRNGGQKASSPEVIPSEP